MRKLAVSALFAVFMISCNSAKNVPGEVLTSSEWEVSMLNGKSAKEASFGRGVPTATFTNDNKVSGFAGCNRYGGNYVLNDDGTFDASQVFATKMYCEGVDGESLFLEALEKADKVKVEKDKITLLNKGNEVIVFIPSLK